MIKHNSKISENIKKYRRLQKHTISSLSVCAKLPFQTVAKIDSGATNNPGVWTLHKIANALKVTVDDLLK